MNFNKDMKKKSVKRQQYDQNEEENNVPAKFIKMENKHEIVELTNPNTRDFNAVLDQNEEDFLKRLKCPVCFELPRNGPIFGCHNGHHACQTCHPKLKQCSICRDTDLKCRQLMTEEILQSVMKDVSVKCKHIHCNVEGLMEQITAHEKLCVARQIPCPMSFRGVCDFKGDMREFFEHIRDGKCCQKSMFPEWKRDSPDQPFEQDSVFQCNVCDNKYGNSVLGRSGIETFWKPTLFLSKKIFNAGMACLFISRHTDHTWRLIAQALVPRDIVKQWTVTIEVSNFKDENAPIFTFKGQPVSYEVTSIEAFETGRVMILKDEQIRPLKNADTNHLFQYRIKFELNKEFEAKCLNLVNGNFTLQEKGDFIYGATNSVNAVDEPAEK